MEKKFEWEATYGFCAMNTSSNEHLAATLEAIRRTVCAYGGGDYCDCKYGLQAAGETGRYATYNDRTERLLSEQTGCPELRELIHRLLYRTETFGI